MKTPLFKFLIAFFITACIGTFNAQVKKNAGNAKDYPTVFTLKKQELDGLLARKINSTLPKTANKYLAGGTVLTNTASGDMKFLRMQLSYFKNAFLTVQVNGSTSTQVFILSTDKSVSYKGKFENDRLVMTKCQEDEIVSE